MLTDIHEEQRKKSTKIRKHRSSSTQHKLNTTPASKVSETPRKKHRSPTKKRTDSSKLTKEERKYQRFVNGLKNDIETYLNQCLRESRFDTRGSQCLQMNPSIAHKRAASTLGSHRTNEIDTVITSASNQQDPLSFLKKNEIKRLTADVQTILTGPALKTFYTQFIRRRPEQSSNPSLHFRLLEESLLWSNEQD